MTFKQYLAAIQANNEIYSIQEFCNGRFIGTHLTFGYTDVDDTEMVESEDYILYGPDVDTTPTFIDSNQQIELKPNDPMVYVTDRAGNHLCLIFYKSEIIAHPTI